jgi:hypothetical protein
LGITFYIEKKGRPGAYLVGPNGPYRRSYSNVHAVPFEFRAGDGFVSQTTLPPPNPPQLFLYFPVGNENDFTTLCFRDGTNQDRFITCGLIAIYAPDPSLTITVRIYHPAPITELAPRLHDITNRVREILYCLDVTENPPTDPVAAFELLILENPELRGCALPQVSS